MEYKKEIEKAINSNNPIESFKEFVLLLNGKGLSKNEIYNELNLYFYIVKNIKKKKRKIY